MSSYYRIHQGTEVERHHVLEALPRLNTLEPTLREAVTTAWTSAWLSSQYESLDLIPYSLQAPGYRLIDHTNEVADVGLLLLDYARNRWDIEPDADTLLAILLLHDLDKALLYTRDGEGNITADPFRSGIPHGVLGAMLLKEIGLPDNVITVVATHATTSPLKNPSAEAWLLHYADLFACDHAFRQDPTAIPFYQRN